jgi:hypothetical protein
MIGTPIAGALGEFLPYGVVQVIFQMAYLIGILAFILPPKNNVRELYNYSTKCDDQPETTEAALATGEEQAAIDAPAADAQDCTVSQDTENTQTMCDTQNP